MGMARSDVTEVTNMLMGNLEESAEGDLRAGMAAFHCLSAGARAVLIVGAIAGCHGNGEV